MSDTRHLKPITALRGALRPPGDKSLSHRALIFAAAAAGESQIRRLAPGEDTHSTWKCLERLGVRIDEVGGAVRVRGRGLAAIHRDPDAEALELDCGNSGTTARLLLGVLAARRGRYRLVGDASLSSRPMGRVIRPLTAMGAEFEGGETLPLTVVGRPLVGGEFNTEVPSAQIKSALLLAALQADGPSTIEEARLSRDHSERLLLAMGARIESAPDRRRLHVSPLPGPLAPLRWRIPGDPSSAAFLVALAASLPESELMITGVSLNETRLGFYRLLQRMGAEIAWEVETVEPEPVGRCVVRGAALRGIEVGAEDVVGAIDELPLLACLAALATGPSRVVGAGELRHKESDRIAATSALLASFALPVQELEDGWAIAGGGVPVPQRPIDPLRDHRIAMCAAVLAAHGSSPALLGDASCVGVSYPEFFEELERLSA